MTANRLFLFGYSYTGAALVKRLRDASDWSFAATTRNRDKQDILRAGGVDAVLWDGALPDDALDGATHILISTPPGEDGCPAYLATADAIRERAGTIKWIGYLSTNGVYGDHAGAWVDETSELRGVSPRAKRRIKAEDAWTGLCADGLNSVIFRLPGIYGPGRSAFDALRAGRARRIFKEGQNFSRMHVEDIAAALAASIANPRAGTLFNLADDEPAPPQDVVEYGAGLIGADVPPLVPIDKADLSEMAKSFYADSKRVSNKRMKELLLPALAYPTYREGLAAILKAEG